MSKPPPQKTSLARKGYTDKLSRQEVIDLFNSGKYQVCTQTGVVSGARGRPLYTFTAKDSEHLWVRLFHKHKHITIGVSHIVWMVATGCVLPPEWEVHHRDLDPSNNSFDNLMALHPKDHRKLHNLEEAPF